MGQIKTKSSLIASRHEVQDQISKFTKHLSLEQKSEVLRASNVLAELSASEKHAALDVIRQQDTNGELNYPWLASFLMVIGKIKAEESRSEDK